MPASVLTTKLFVPPPRPNLVSRPRLIQRLDEGLSLGHRLALVSAPAGFGKTTMLSTWVGSFHSEAARENQIGNRIAWLSLDEDDNDPVRFLTYLVAALQTTSADIGQGTLNALQSPRPPAVHTVLTVLINDITAIPGRVVLILDDYHLIEAQAIHDALTFLLRHLPPQMHVVLATREDPHLPLARWRARSQMTELRATELRFTFSEAAEFLNQGMGLDLSAEDIAVLERRTEGWIAGLQLAALSMQGRKDTTGLIASFTGRHRFVLDYLVEEVLEQQSSRVQTFLLQTAIASRLTGPLCDALTGQENGQETLETLERANLFVVSLDNERRWYRYHHLFSDLLQQRLRVAHPDLLNDLHSKAAIWYERNGYYSEAIRHALAMADVETATRLMEKGALEALERSDLGRILNWVDLLSDAALKSSPWLFAYHSWALLLTGQVASASSRLENIDWLHKAIAGYDESRKREMSGLIAGLKAILALWQRDFVSGLDFANQALENLAENNWIRGYCAIVLGSSFWGNGNLDAARGAFAESCSVGKASANKMLAVSGACNLAHTLELEGRLQQALKLFRDSYQLAEQDGEALPVAGYVHVELARILYELNDLDAASQHLSVGIRLCQQLADGRAEKIGHCLLARVLLAQGKYADAVDSIQKAQRADPSPGTPFDLRGAEYPQVRLWLKRNRLMKVEAWLQESGVNIDQISHFKTRLTYTMHARALIALGREHPDSTHLQAALDLLDTLLKMAESTGWGNKLVEILALRALAYSAAGDDGQAMTLLQRALTLAEPEGFVRTFVDEGPPMARLLYEALSHGIAPDYVRRLLAAFPSTETEQAATPITEPAPVDLVEPLSERELEILQLIAEGLTNPEIASRLYLALNTVKAHTRNIYGKLSVHSRTQAIARSRVLGILPRT